MNLLVRDEREARVCARAPLELFECPACGSVWNAVFESVPYDERYQIDPGRSPRFAAHKDSVIEHIAQAHPATTPLHVLEIGAGQGVFLSDMSERLGARVRHAHGYDPAFRGEPCAKPVTMTRGFFDAPAASALSFTPNVVVLRHLIEHLHDPVSFLSSLRQALGEGTEHALLVETPNVSHSLEQGLLHDFYYEHCTLLSKPGLAFTLARAGYDAAYVDDHAFAGEYLVALARPACAPIALDAPSSLERRSTLRGLAERFVPEHRARLSLARTAGPVVVWGGAGKGAMFAHLVDPERELVDAVVDIHEAKHGMRLPGTGHPLISPKEAGRMGVRSVFVVNMTYFDEIKRQCLVYGIDAKVERVGNL